MRRWLLLDVNGPLGQIAALWVETLTEMKLEAENEKKRKRLIELFASKEYKKKPEAYREIAELVEHFMRNEDFQARFENKLREHLGRHRETLADLFGRFDRIILYSDMPHSVVRFVAKILRDITERSVDAVGYHPRFPAPYDKWKQVYSFLVPHDKVEVWHVTDRDPPLRLKRKGFAGYVHIPEVNRPEDLQEKVLPRLLEK